jgi:type II secretory pathway component GspD/PulD (secretin)
VPWKNRSSVGIIVILLGALGLVLSSGSGLTQVASEKTPTLISLDVKKMNLQDVLRLIAEKANVNIIAGREVAGSVTLRLKNVDLWQALGAILGASGFTYREEEGIIRVVKLEELVEEKPPLVTEIILLKYTKAEDVKKAFQHLLSSSGTMEIDPTSNALVINDISQNIEKIREVVTKLDTEPPTVLEKKQFKLNYIDTTEEGERDLLKDALGYIIGEEGNFFIDSLTNSVYVEAPSSYIKEVKRYFEGADISPRRVIIKAEFVEVRLSALEEVGIKWRWKGAYEEYPLGATFRYPYQTRSESGETATNPGPSTLAAGMGIIFGSAEQEFRGIIDLLISEGKAYLLSSPNIVTLEGQEAKIDVGDKHPYRVTKYIEGAWVETIEFVTVGATLVVTPHIKEEKKVVLDIHPDVSELTGPPPFTGAPPIVGTREAESRITVQDGKTIVVGGLLRETEKKTREGIPFLSRLPILGSLFTRREITREKTDLLVFITPYILPEKLEEENIIEKRRPLKVQIEELYQKGLDYKKLGEYEKARECFEEVIKKSRMYSFSHYLESAKKELSRVERLEKKLKKMREEKTIREKLPQTGKEPAKKKRKGFVVILAAIFLTAALSSK